MKDLPLFKQLASEDLDGKEEMDGAAVCFFVFWYLSCRERSSRERMCALPGFSEIDRAPHDWKG